ALPKAAAAASPPREIVSWGQNISPAPRDCASSAPGAGRASTAPPHRVHSCRCVAASDGLVWARLHLRLRRLRCVPASPTTAEFAMSQRQQHAPPAVCSIADHLDGALAACEDLLALAGDAAAPEPFLNGVVRLELTIIMHVLQLRQR